MVKCAFLISLSIALYNQLRMMDAHKSNDLKGIVYHGNLQ